MFVWLVGFFCVFLFCGLLFFWHLNIKDRKLYNFFFTKGGESKPRTNLVTVKKSKKKNKGKNGSLEETNESSVGSRRTVRLCLRNIVQY